MRDGEGFLKPVPDRNIDFLVRRFTIPCAPAIANVAVRKEGHHHSCLDGGVYWRAPSVCR